jgi:hypothetical protein
VDIVRLFHYYFVPGATLPFPAGWGLWHSTRRITKLMVALNKPKHCIALRIQEMLALFSSVLRDKKRKA